MLSIKPCLHTQLPEHNKSYDGAFEQLSGLRRGEFEQKFSKKYKCPGGCPGGGDVEASI